MMSSTTGVYLKLNNTTDADVLERLSEVGNKQGYIKALVRADIERSSTMTTYRYPDGREIMRYSHFDQLAACDTLRSVMLEECHKRHVDVDMSETHCVDLPWWEVETERTSTMDIAGWSEFERKWRSTEHDFPFAAMSNGYAYEYLPHKGYWELSFDWSTFGEGEVDGYPHWMDDGDRLGCDAPSQLYEVTLAFEGADVDTGVYTGNSYVQFVYPEGEPEE